MAQPQPSWKIALRLLALLLLFYLGAYAAAGVIVGIFDLTADDDATLPFQFNVGIDNARQSGALTCLVVEIVWLSVACSLVLRDVPRLWDYFLTVLLIHLALSAWVTARAPNKWRWWVTVIVTGVGGMACAYSLVQCQRRYSRWLQSSRVQKVSP